MHSSSSSSLAPVPPLVSFAWHIWPYPRAVLLLLLQLVQPRRRTSCVEHAHLITSLTVSVLLSALLSFPAAGAAKKKDKLLTMDSSEITYEMVAKKLREIVTSRGRKGTDKQEQVRLLQCKLQLLVCCGFCMRAL
jgi:hypothetical protein